MTTTPILFKPFVPLRDGTWGSIASLPRQIARVAKVTNGQP